jgi:hypothetical protein
MITNPNTLKISVLFNPKTKQWVARRKVLTPHLADDGISRDNQYGYGESLMDAVDAIVTQTSRLASRIMCKAITPGRHIHTIKMD